jgi:hypothetical protein
MVCNILGEEENKEKPLNSLPGSFSQELNKMMFTSSLLELFHEHNLQFPKSLFENSDFVSELFSFLKSYGINPPALSIPKFKITNSQFPIKDHKDSSRREDFEEKTNGPQ